MCSLLPGPFFLGPVALPSLPAQDLHGLQGKASPNSHPQYFSGCPSETQGFYLLFLKQILWDFRKT